MNRAVEDELPALTAHLPVGLHWARVRPDTLPRDPSDETYLSNLLAAVPAAIERLAPDDLDAIVLACTSATIDQTAVMSLAPPGYSSLRIVTAYDCLRAALFDKPTLLCTPYSDELATALACQLERDGCRIAGCVRIPVTGEFRDVPQESVAAVLAASLRPGVVQIAISCTALYTSVVGELLRNYHGVSWRIVSSISAIGEYIDQLCKTHEGA